MRFSSTLVAIFASAILAAPSHNVDGDPGAYVTTDPEWGYRETSGSYRVFTTKAGNCQDLVGTVFDKTISSFGPNKGVECVAYSQYNCKGTREPDEKIRIVYPGYALLQNFNWEDKISSFNCSWA